MRVEVCLKFMFTLLADVMERWDLKHRIFAVEQYFATKSIIQSQRNFKRHFKTTAAPSRNSILSYVEAFNERGNVINKPKPICCRTTARTVDNIEQVRQAITQSPHKSIRRLSQQMNLSYGSIHSILCKDLKSFPYKIQLVQQLCETDRPKRELFSQWLLQRFQEDPSFIDHVFFSDEAHFNLSGYVNKQNCRFWATENPQNIHEDPLHSAKLTVWCAVSGRCIIGPYFFTNDEGDTVTVNGDRYREMISTFFIPELRRRRINLRRVWFQQDGATCHTANETLAILQHAFPGHLISRRGDVDWPPRSPDLTPPDFFLWGYLKSIVYKDNPHTLLELRDTIERCVNEIDKPTLHRVMENVVVRARECVGRGGSHLESIIFKI